jgi:hypothetical protein
MRRIILVFMAATILAGACEKEITVKPLSDDIYGEGSIIYRINKPDSQSYLAKDSLAIRFVGYLFVYYWGEEYIDSQQNGRGYYIICGRDSMEFFDIDPVPPIDFTGMYSADYYMPDSAIFTKTEEVDSDQIITEIRLRWRELPFERD